MKVWSLGVVLCLAAVVGGCGGNSTAIGVTVSAAGVASGTTATVLENQTLQFSASVTGGGMAYWQICLPAINSITQPTTCTAIPGITAPSGTTLLTGYGTITQTGLYTAPPSIPSPNSFVVMASSTVQPTCTSSGGTAGTCFGLLDMQVDSGIRVQLTPSSATIAALEHFQFTKTVTGSSNTGVTWSVNGIAGGNATVGYICPNPAVPCAADGEYFAPAAAPGSVTITAAAVADSSKTATATVTITGVVDPIVTSVDPTIAAQGSAQQDVYLTGSNFDSNDTVVVTPSGQTGMAVPTTFISTGLLRATIPWNLMTLPGALPLVVQTQGDLVSSAVNLSLISVRPAVISSLPDTTTQSATNTSVNLTGGFFSPGTTTVQFNGSSVAPTIANSRQLSIAVPNVSTPGLYPITVHNAGISAGQPSSSSLNLSVSPSTVPSAPSATVAVGLNPSAVAIDYASDVAVVVNTGNGTANGTVSLVNLATTPPALITTIAVGKSPTGVAVDDLLTPNVALVVNSGDQTVSTINLTTQTVTSVLSVAIGPTGGSPAGPAPVPFSIGINSLTHRAVVAYESFNEATILDVSTGAPVLVSQIGGNATIGIGTGAAPAVAIDPRLNWAVISAGGSGIQTTNIVDLGHNAILGDVARVPDAVASFGAASMGVGINAETHQALLTDPGSDTFTSYSLLDNSVNPITYTLNGTAISQLGYVAAAADSLTNVGVAVNSNSATATVVNLESGVVLGTATLPAGPANAVAIDPISNQAVIVSPGSSTLSILPLGPAINSLQIVEASPSVTFTSSTTPLTLTITGGGFASGSVVLLDGVSLTPSSIASNGRQLVVSVPASMLGAARRYAVQVQSGSSLSNVTDLTVVQSVAVGNAPVGVAVDTDRDLAVVTNSGSNTVSLLALSTATPVGMNQIPAGTVGVIGQPVSVGSSPLGVAVLPRFGLALVANNGSTNVSLVDVTQVYPPQTFTDCSSGSACTGQTGVAIDQDTGAAVITNSTSNNNIANNTSNNVSFVTIAAPTSTSAPSLSVQSVSSVDLNPLAVAIQPVVNAINPDLGYAAITTASQASSIELLTVPGATFTQRFLGLQVPTGIVFDPSNQVFLVANSLLNNVIILDPNAFTQTSVRVGVNPTALDYDYQSSTLVTVNQASSTISVLDYVCPPPSGGSSTCPNPQVQTVLGFGGSQEFSVAVDAKLNLAVVADQANNRVLLIPLPH